MYIRDSRHRIIPPLFEEKSQSQHQKQQQDGGCAVLCRRRGTAYWNKKLQFFYYSHISVRCVRSASTTLLFYTSAMFNSADYSS